MKLIFSISRVRRPILVFIFAHLQYPIGTFAQLILNQKKFVIYNNIIYTIFETFCIDVNIICQTFIKKCVHFPSTNTASLTVAVSLSLSLSTFSGIEFFFFKSLTANKRTFKMMDVSRPHRLKCF